MKKLIYTLLSVATAITLTTQISFAEDSNLPPSIPSWAHKGVNKVIATTGITDEKKKIAIFKAIEARGKAIKAASDKGETGDALKTQTKAAWSTYINTMKKILSAEQFEKFNAQRLSKR